MYERLDYDRATDEQMKLDLGKDYDFRQHYDDTIDEVLDIFERDYDSIDNLWRAVYERAVEREIENSSADNIEDFAYEMCAGKLNDLAGTIYCAVVEKRIDAYEQLVSDYGEFCPKI